MDRLVRLKEILIGTRNRPALIPMSTTTWRRGVKSGVFPQPIILGHKSHFWRESDIKEFMATYFEKKRAVKAVNPYADQKSWDHSITITANQILKLVKKCHGLQGISDKRILNMLYLILENESLSDELSEYRGK